MNKQNQAKTVLNALIEFYKKLKGEYERGWSYKTVTKFIQEHKALNKKDKDIQLELIEILESPYEEGLKKINDIEFN